MHGRDPSNEIRHQSQPKKTKVRLLYLLISQEKGSPSYALYNTNKIEHFSFKIGCVIWVVKRLKEDLFIVLR